MNAHAGQELDYAGFMVELVYTIYFYGKPSWPS